MPEIKPRTSELTYRVEALVEGVWYVIPGRTGLSLSWAELARAEWTTERGHEARVVLEEV